MTWLYETYVQQQIIAMRLNDVRNGSNVTEDVLTKYRAAWKEKGMIGADGLLKDMWLVKQDTTIPAKDPGFSAWSNAFMNSWNSEFVKASYDHQALGFITTVNGQTELQPPLVGNAYRQLVNEDTNGTKAPKQLLDDARELAQTKILEKEASKSMNVPLSLLTKPILGYVTQWLSELGRPELEGLLQFVDENLNPTWENGGLYYPRNDKPWNDKLTWTHMDPFSGNAAIGYSRLHVKDGMKKLWEEPWTQKQVQAQPWLDGVTLADNVDLLRGQWDAERKVMVVTMKSWDASIKTINPIFKNLSAGIWEVIVDGQAVKKEKVQKGGEMSTIVEVDGTEVDVLAVKRE